MVRGCFIEISPIGAPGSLSRIARLDEAGEEADRIMRPGRCLRMKLDREGLLLRDLKALARSVVEVDVRRAGPALERRDIDREAVVLRRDLDAAGREIFDGLVHAAVAEFQLVRARPDGQGQELVAEANAE